MLSKEDNERITRVEPGTQTGALMRRYWIPALLLAEISGPDGPSVRVSLLGERVVAFRARTRPRSTWFGNKLLRFASDRALRQERHDLAQHAQGFHPLYGGK